MIVAELTAKECREALIETGFGRLACARDDQPYIVPIFFVMDEDKLYSFSVAGRKIEWMRENPRVCVEVDSIKSWNDWTSVVVFGRYEELPDTPDWQAERRRAHHLLEQRAMWWQPASVEVSEHAGEVFLPIFFRIILERPSGHRGLSGLDETGLAAHDRGRAGWWQQLFRLAKEKH